MKTIFLFFCIIALAGTITFISCQKELSCQGCAGNNKPPIAIAGPDQVITLPTDSISLNGTTSSDPDGKISEWLWTKISGPVSFNVANASAARTVVKNIAAGVYQFELKVTDNGRLFAKDTIRVIVDSIATTSHRPVANAGIDQTISLPANSINLDGGGSDDPDNDIISFVWAKISGPSLFNIVNANAVQTQVINLIEGVYLFELKVTDAESLFSKDTLQITVNPAVPNVACDNSNRPIINGQLVPIGILSKAREAISVAAAGNKILFAGGGINSVNSAYSSRVDIYDINTNTWSTAELCVGRNGIAAVANGNKIFFAGGEVGDGTWPVDSVDIYDVSANTWTVSHLSRAGYGIVAAAVGNKVLFAGGEGGFSGGNRSTTVDIYDLTTNTWSTAPLSSEGKRGGHAAVTIDNKVYFAGGESWSANLGNWYCSDRIDIYDNNTNTWSAGSLTEGKLGLAGIAVNSKIYWSGGKTGTFPSISPTCSVEIKDVNNENTSIQYFSRATDWAYAVLKDNKIAFFSGYPNKFDIYEISTSTWSIGVMPMDIIGASIISVNNTIYVAGGEVNGVLSNQVWKLEF